MRAFIVAQHIFNLNKVWKDIEALDNKVSVAVQHKMMMQVTRLIRRTTRWFLRNRRMYFDISNTINEFSADIKILEKKLPELLAGESVQFYNKIVKDYLNANVPVKLAEHIAKMRSLSSAMDIIEAKNTQQADIIVVANIYYSIGSKLQLDWVRSEVLAHSVENHWEALSRQALRDDIDWQQRELTTGVINYMEGSKSTEACINAWLEEYQSLINRWNYLLSDIRKNTSKNFIMFFVTVRELLDLTQTSSQSAEILAKSKVNRRINLKHKRV